MEVAVVDYQSKNAASEFTHSIKHTGFAVLKNHLIDKASVDRLYQLWETFFNSDDKYQYRFNPETQDGFFPFEHSETAKGYNVRDLKEFFHAYPWGQMPDFLREETLEMYQRLNNLAIELLDWIEKNTPDEIRQKLSMPLSDMVKNNPRTLFRILHYPPLPDNVPEGAVRAAAHEDINLITLLLAATETGLEVKDAEGQWHTVPCDHGMIAVNAGDMLQLATEYYYRSTTHRVINPQGEAAKRSRFSMPLFLHARDDVLLAENKTATQYRLERLKELGLIKS
ncbi:MAG: isopenicillin N synthase family oxygenase [Legionellales bacterium]|nr:isopenicillin N synthase family oxygenase [Legionellales bacterium]